MRNVLVILLFTQLFIGQSLGQDKGLLYKIQKKGGKASYIFGTIHIIPDTAFFFPPKLVKTLEKSEMLVLELSQDEMSAGMGSSLKRTSGETFSIFTKEQQDSIINWGSELIHLDTAKFRGIFNQLKPFALLQIGAQDLFKGPVKSYELEFIRTADSKNIPIDGLESMDYQLGLFEGLSDELVKKLVLETMRDSYKKENGKILVETYLSQDITKLNELMVLNGVESTMADILVYDRNKQWIRKIKSFMQTNSCFFAVGAGHLGGDKGVIQLLRKEGYNVEVVEL